MTSTPSDHAKDHHFIAAALTDSRRGWLTEAHLAQYHAQRPADTTVPPANRADSLQALHLGLHAHDEAPPATRIAVVNSIADDLAGGLEWLAAADPEAAETVFVGFAAQILERLEDPRTPTGGRLRRAWAGPAS